jgi:hypothetical protein
LQQPRSIVKLRDVSPAEKAEGALVQRNPEAGDIGDDERGGTMDRGTHLSFLLTATFLCGCGQKPAEPAKAEVAARRQEKAITIPADSFLLAVEHQPVPAVMSREIKKTVALECSPTPKGEILEPLLFWVGAGEKKQPISHFGNEPVGPNRRTQFDFILKPAGTDDRLFKFGLEAKSEPRSLSSTSGDFRLMKGQSLADVLKVDVQPGLYKIGSPVRLGSIRWESGDYPLMLYVYWQEDADKERSPSGAARPGSPGAQHGFSDLGCAADADNAQAGAD